MKQTHSIKQVNFHLQMPCMDAKRHNMFTTGIPVSSRKKQLKPVTSVSDSQTNGTIGPKLHSVVWLSPYLHFYPMFSKLLWMQITAIDMESPRVWERPTKRYDDYDSVSEGSIVGCDSSKSPQTSVRHDQLSLGQKQQISHSNFCFLYSH